MDQRANSASPEIVLSNLPILASQTFHYPLYTLNFWFSPARCNLLCSPTHYPSAEVLQWPPPLLQSLHSLRGHTSLLLSPISLPSPSECLSDKSLWWAACKNLSKEKIHTIFHPTILYLGIDPTIVFLCTGYK